MRKGQAAMEFLMTYGWAILVVLAAIAALAYFGVFNQSNFLPEACNFGPGFSCAHKATATQVQMKLTNGGGKTLTSFNVTVEDCNATHTTATFADGAEIDVVVTGCNWGGETKVKKDITFAYVEEGGFDHNKTGKLVAQIES